MRHPQDKGVDSIVYDRSGQAILIAQVKGRLGTSRDWATLYRRNILAHGLVPKALFFLIATPEWMYFWKQDAQSAGTESPTFTLSADKALKPYLDKLQRPSQSLGEEALELLVSAWLSDIAVAGNVRIRQDPSMNWLAESGLIGALATARIEFQPA